MDIEKYVKLRHLRSRSVRFLSVFSIITVIIVASALALPGITESREPFCGLTEHKHDHSCYGVVSELACIYSEEKSVTEQKTTAEETTSEAKETVKAEETTVEETTTGEEASRPATTEEIATETETTTVETTDNETTKEETTVLAEETTVEETVTADNHIHNDSCYIYGNKLLCALTEHTHDDSCYPDSEKITEETEKNVNTQESETSEEDAVELTDVTEKIKDENGLTVVGIAGRPQKEIDDYILKITKAFENLPDYEELEEKINEFEDNEDYDGEEAYLTQVKEQALEARQMYLVLDGYKDQVENSHKLFDLEFLWNMSEFTSTGEDTTVEPYMINYYSWSTVSDDNVAEPVIFYGGSGSYWGYTGFTYWMMIEVGVHEEGHLYVKSINTDISGSDDKSRYTPEDGGFIILLHDSDTENWDNAQKVTVTDVVTADFDYTTRTTYTNVAIGTLTFSTYVPPVEPDPDEPFIPDTSGETEVTIDGNDPLWYTSSSEASDRQVVSGGGKFISADGNIITTKTINGTSEENVFDITLTVQTSESFDIVLSEPDMAVVIVMDISNTMNSTVGYEEYVGDPTRYDAAIVAAEQFIRSFANNTKGISKIGFVAFNTHAHKIFDLTPCSTEKDAANVENIISTMKSETEDIIDNYGSEDPTRFTNVEGGLKMGYDMLNAANNANKYIIFLSDGFPTTYLDNDTSNNTADKYFGYNPYTSSGTKGADGVFYDYVTGYYCKLGTSYSDKASIKARKMATQIKKLGAEIFSIGVDVGTQTIAGFETTGLSVIDRTGTTYEIGDAESEEAYTNWLKNRIGSGYYYDSENSTDLSKAFENIFAQIQEINENSSKTVWSATDPMPVYDEDPSIVGFIHFYDKDGNVIKDPDNPENIIGTHAEGGENTANHENNTIFWDLKKSGYTKSTDPDDDTVTYYLYKLKYRVRLVNEKTTSEAFEDGREYNTNGNAYLEYKIVETVDEVQSISDPKYVSFAHPSVRGYLVPLTFMKVNSFGTALPGAEFSLRHDDTLCVLCHGDGTAITDDAAHDLNYKDYNTEDGYDPHAEHFIGPYTAVSDSEGKVAFGEVIPSGHTYILEETVIPEGHKSNGSTYSLVASYDTVTVYETKSDGTAVPWKMDESDTVTNPSDQILPETGGIGTTYLYIIGGLLTALSSVFLLCLYKNDRERRRRCLKK